MKQGRVEIVIVRPTAVFRAFLRAQLSPGACPSWESLQTDCTAYVIRYSPQVATTVHEIEVHYAKIFRHEMSRWLGPEVSHSITDQFLDFLCCFKLEFHTHLIVLEPVLQHGQQLLCLKPRDSLLSWLRELVVEQEELSCIMTKVRLSHLVENATLIVKNFESLLEITPFIRDNYSVIFEAAMRRMCDQPQQWPLMNSYALFIQYFSIELHTQLIHLT